MLRAAIVQSFRFHYECLGCFLQWRLDTQYAQIFDYVALIFPVKDNQAQQWLEWYRGLGLCREDPSLPKLRIMDSDDVTDATLAEFALIIWPTDDDHLMLYNETIRSSVKSRSISMCHFPEGPRVPVKGSVYIRAHHIATATDFSNVVIPCHQGISSAEAKRLRGDSDFEPTRTSLCVIGGIHNPSAAVHVQAAADAGASMHFVSREERNNLPGCFHEPCQIVNASVSEMIAEMLAVDAVLVAKDHNFATKYISGSIGTCLSLLVPILLPEVMMKIFPGTPPAGCVAYNNDNNNPVTAIRRLLSNLNLDTYAADRDKLIMKNVKNIDAQVLHVLGSLTTIQPLQSHHHLGVPMHCVWMQLGNPLYRGFPIKYEDNINQWRRLNGPVKVWNTSDILELVSEHYPKHYNAFIRLRPLILAADIARFMIVGALGGLYFDLDIRCTRPLLPLLEHEQDYFMMEPEKHGDLFLVGMFFARHPKHPFVISSVDVLMDAAAKAGDDGKLFTPRLIREYAASLGNNGPTLRRPCALCPITDAQTITSECLLQGGTVVSPIYSYTVWTEGTGHGRWTDKQRQLRVIPWSVENNTPYLQPLNIQYSLMHRLVVVAIIVLAIIFILVYIFLQQSQPDARA